MATRIHSPTIFSEIERTTEHRRPLIELTSEQKQLLQTAAGAALALIATAGVIAIAAGAPNVFQAIDKVYRFTRGKKLPFKDKQAKTAQTFYYLKRQGLIQIQSNKNVLFARITEKGKQKMEKLNLDTLRIKRPKNWDGKWWLVAADIPTKDYRWAADLLRKKIKQMQFYPLQRTLWLYPYNPVREIEFLSQHFGIARFVTVMEVSRLDKDDERRLKSFFSL